MYIIRPIQKEDLDTYFSFAERAAIGIHTLPKNRDRLAKRIDISIGSFKKNVHTPQDEIYIFVIENFETKEVVGTCAINARTGSPEPVHFFKIITVHPHSNEPIVPKELQMLQVTNYTNGPSEVCGIYLKPEVRKERLGHLLSLSRLLFIASFPQRFKRNIIAQMRGVIDLKNNSSPFWEGLGINFTTLTFSEVQKKMESNSSFINDILPQNPVYVSLLPKFSQKVMEKVHISTKPAFKMLLNEGFKLTGEIDVFDGGPIVKAEIQDIETIKNSHFDTIHDVVSDQVNWNDYLICNGLIDFKACMGQLKRYGHDQIIITQAVADALQVKKGDVVRWSK
jgi:arginine N-succinyltransferase